MSNGLIIRKKFSQSYFRIYFLNPFAAGILGFGLFIIAIFWGKTFATSIPTAIELPDLYISFIGFILLSSIKILKGLNQ